MHFYVKPTFCKQSFILQQLVLFLVSGQLDNILGMYIKYINHLKILKTIAIANKYMET